MIEHPAVITDITKDTIYAEILVKEACQHCAASANCTLSQAKTKNIQIPNHNPELKIGDKIIVSISVNQSSFALFFAYILPLFIVLSVLFTLINMGFSENISGIFSIICLIPYYFGLWFYHRFFAKKLTLSIKKEDEIK